jgi:hypothetical protein
MLKRLIRKAYTRSVQEFIADLLKLNEFDENQVETLIGENPDCAFNGEAYRVFFFEEEEVKRLGEKYAEEAEDAEDLLDIVLSSLIDVDWVYRSFSKTMAGIKEYERTGKGPNTFNVVIRYNVQNGLDIDKLYEKHIDEFEDGFKTDYEGFKGEEEILAKFDDESYEIEDAEDIEYYLYELINGDPTEDL